MAYQNINKKPSDESIKINKEYSKLNTDYFFRQLEKPNRSTGKFFDFLEDNNLIRNN